jgi:cytochrome bd-type quinol oxidase subunit 2
MAEISTTSLSLAAAAGGSASAGAGLALGMPPSHVIVAAVLGAAVATWVQHAEKYEASRRWIAGAGSTAMLAVLLGLAAPGVVMALGPQLDGTPFAWLARVYDWILAVCAAAGSQGLIWLLARAKRRLGGSIDSQDDKTPR